MTRPRCGEPLNPVVAAMDDLGVCTACVKRQHRALVEGRVYVQRTTDREVTRAQEKR